MSQPSTEGEKILYRVLEKANLTNYYSAFVSQGGDDVQQLCEAGEEEFLEIMALVGMATKPLQVRRLQKALQEWVASPHLFFSDNAAKEVVVTPPRGSILDVVKKMGFSTESFEARPISNLQLLHPSTITVRNPIGASATRSLLIKKEVTAAAPIKETPAPTPALEPMWKSPDLSPSPATLLSNGTSNIDDRSSSATPPSLDAVPASYNPFSETSLEKINQAIRPQKVFIHKRKNNNNTPSPPSSHQGGTPCKGLTEEQIQSISAAIEEVLPQLPKFEVKRGRMKKIGNKEALKILDMDPNDPLYLPLLRKYSAIYGRFDCKRKIDKPMCLHEYYVNEASFRLCQRIPELISRRNELFPIARAVVRKSGYKFTKGKSRAQVELLDRNNSSTPQKLIPKSLIKKEPNGDAISTQVIPDPTSSNTSVNDDSEGPSSLSELTDAADAEHNMRLLQAYGMYDLAQEFKKNQGKRELEEDDDDDDDSDVDEQEEWNKQIEEDSKHLNITSGSESNSPAKKFKMQPEVA